MALPKSSGDDICMSPHELGEMRYALPITGKLSDANFEKVVQYIRQLMEWEGNSVYDVIMDRGVAVLDPAQQWSYLTDIGYDKILNKIDCHQKYSEN